MTIFIHSLFWLIFSQLSVDLITGMIFFLLKVADVKQLTRHSLFNNKSSICVEEVRGEKSKSLREDAK
jgi:hypothetical protein